MTKLSLLPEPSGNSPDDSQRPPAVRGMCNNRTGDSEPDDTGKNALRARQRPDELVFVAVAEYKLPNVAR